MNQAPTTINTSETRALGDYAIRQTSKREVVKHKFYRHMLEKSRRFAGFNPFDLRAQRAKFKKSNSARDKEDDKGSKELRKLKEVTEESQDIIYTAKSIFPFALFPDTIHVDRHKLTIIYKIFFWTEQTISVPITDIKNIQADIGPFLGSLTVTSDHFINNTQTIKFLKRSDVKCIQELVQGAMVASKEEIDTTKVETGELRNLLTDLGKGHSGATA